MNFRSSFFRLPDNRSFTYKPLYYNEEEEERKQFFVDAGHQTKSGLPRQSNIRMQQGAFFRQKNRSPIAGAFSTPEIAYRRRNHGARGQVMRILVLIILISIPILYILEYIGIVSAVGLMGVAFLLLLLNFIRTPKI